jgi:hypothetical protein
MRAGRFFAVFGMVAILASSRVAHADLDNGEKSSAPKRVALDDFLESVSELKKLEDKPPASEEALRRRARPRSQPARRCRAQPRLLGRGILLRGRHSSRPGKGYGDGQAPTALPCRLGQGAGTRRTAAIDPPRRKEAAAQRTQHYELVGVPTYVKLDTTDNLLNPTTGYRAQLAAAVPHRAAWR